MEGFWPIGNKFVGVVLPTAQAETPSRVHHIWIEDQSGSMGWAVDQVAKDMVAHLGETGDGDVLSVGYFSGVGDFRWFVKGARLTNQADRDAVAKIILNNARSRNTTCFSEILADVKQVIEDTAPLADTVQLAFLTDGHPVVPSYDREKKAIFEAIKSIRNQLSSVLIVGYGDYYNRPLLVEMAQALGATLQHADDIQQFGKRLGEIVVKTGRKRTTITLPKGVEAAFAVENGRVVIYAVDNNSVVAPTGTQVYFVTSDAAGKPVNKISGSKMLDPYEPMYGAALAYLQSGDVSQALQVLSDIGDVAIVQKLGAAMTNKEMGDVENMISDAATNLTKRFLQGQKKGCAPKDDAFDLIDLLNTLQADGQARFYPYHPDFNYKRIGRKTKVDDKYPKFVAGADASTPIAGLVGNAKELNISISTTINGTVALPESVNGSTRDGLGLPDVYPVHVWRSYNLISNALPNVSQLPVSLSKETHNLLKSEGVLPADSKWKDGEIYVLDLLSVPACNRKRGVQATDWNALASLAVQSEEVGNHLKVLKAKLAELDPNQDSKRPVEMTSEQQAYLELCGIKADGTYAPPSTQEDATDVLRIRTLEVKVAKTSPVSVKDFALMHSGDKRMNWVGEMMESGQIDIDENMPKTTAAAVAWLSQRVAEVNREKRSIDAEINARRYAIALGGHWKKYHSGPEASYTVDVPAYETNPTATVTFSFRDDVEKKI